MKILVLDDSLARITTIIEEFGFENPITVCTDVQSAIEAVLSFGRFDLMLIDNDLGDPDYVQEGKEFVKFICDPARASILKTSVIVHSWNTVAASEMTERLNRSGYSANNIAYPSYFESVKKWLKS